METHCELLPLTPPGAGEQYAFEVALDKCSGCKACVTACHSLNGLDETETWRDVGLLVSPPAKPWRQASAIQQVVTTACHHCVEPACLEGCPVLAYEKDSLTGIVRHLDDQCIGCQYCVLKCPYDVPKYNARLGIVRKCDMCAGRLAAEEAPACAQACPNEAIRITKVSKTEITIRFRERGDAFLHDAPEGSYTLPTTRYINGTSALLVAADSTALTPQPAHWPLLLMLVLTQASVGALGAALLSPTAASYKFVLAISIAFALTGLGASVFHLGRPLGAWRAFLNLKRSWMSREIVVFGIYALLLGAAAGGLFVAGIESPLLIRTATLGTGLAGLLGVFCSAMIYADTRRELWRPRRSVAMFFLTTLLLGCGIAFLAAPTSRLLVFALAMAVGMKVGVEILVLRHVTDPRLSSLKKSALLVVQRFPAIAFAHLGCLAVGGMGLPLLVSVEAIPHPEIAAPAALFLLVVGECCERYLFFRCVVAPKMPGIVPS